MRLSCLALFLLTHGCTKLVGIFVFFGNQLISHSFKHKNTFLTLSWREICAYENSHNNFTVLVKKKWKLIVSSSATAEVMMIERKLIYSNTHQKCTLLSNSITFFLLIQICTNTMYCDHVNVQNYKIVNFCSCFRMHGWFLSIECTFSPQIHYVCEDPQVIINNWKFLYDDIKKKSINLCVFQRRMPSSATFLIIEWEWNWWLKLLILIVYPSRFLH